ncbi:DUF6443 domain-containing protein [Flavobacterium sp. UBA7682]|uniref:DUF6443 domain-containing protein n=1 Tax=Flavobacterium sp. UBA7682 TaxID=1946560 RepID=UPI0025BDFE88|nr:DUF6443 domain-containing protein [Flavobacterium sp. UBA7682]
MKRKFYFFALLFIATTILGKINLYGATAPPIYPNVSFTLTASNLTATGSGNIYGSATIYNNVLTVAFGGGWSNGVQLKTSSPILNFGISPTLPNMEIGTILFSNGIPSSTGYFIKIQNNNLVIYSNGTPISLTSCYISISINLNCVDSNGQILDQTTVWYLDDDLDGFGDPASGVVQCYQPDGNYVLDNSDLCPAVYGSLTDCNQVTNTSSSNYNYIRAKTYRVSTAASISNPTILDAYQQVVYYDGLGRPMEKIDNAQSANGKDMITYIEYDEFGRQSKEYLPFVSSQDNMSFLEGTTLIPSLVAQYQTQYGDTNPYSEKQFEASPLNHLLKQAAPGNDWALGQGHEVRLDYKTNIANEVKQFKVIADWSISNRIYETTFVNGSGSVFYPENMLYKTVTKDENWVSGKNNTIEEFKNKSNQVVLKRTYSDYKDINGVILDTEVAHDTYYVYDIYGNLTYVLPPKADGVITQTVLDELCYQYKYDARNRLAEKKLPGKTWEYLVYDKLDRVVMTGPTNPPFSDRTDNGWIITKYDLFNRAVITGWISSGSTISSLVRNDKQLERDNQTSNFNESRIAPGATTVADNIGNIAHSYTYVSKPVSGYHLLSVVYYDDYSYTGAPGVPTTVENDVVFYNNSTNKPKGLVTGKWLRATKTTGSYRNTLSYDFYDNKSRAIRSVLRNHENSPGGYTQTDSKLDFEGKPSYTVTLHKRINSETGVTIRDYYTYTNQGKILAHTQKINNGVIQLIAKNTYDVWGQLISKNVGGTDVINYNGLQKVDYKYNIRGWLKGINDDVPDPITHYLNLDTAENDLFAFRINYNEVENHGTYAGNELFNGNISETHWITANGNGLKKYGYFYDNLNRLKNAVFLQPGSTLPEPDFYNESVEYDKNGNILKLHRNGDNSISLPAFQIDDLTYNYANGNSSNLLKSVQDGFNGNPASGFVDSANTVDEYGYDIFGNMTRDDNKGITDIDYNQLSLPTKITFGTLGTIEYLYDAEGKKMEKIVTQNGAPNIVTTTKYLSGFQYVNDVLQFFPHAEGYVTKTSSKYNYVFNFIDHLGNIRLSYADLDKDGVAEPSEEIIDCSGGGGNCITYYTSSIMKENNYYPFGLEHNGYNGDSSQAVDFKFKYNGKEYQDELALNLYDYTARNYDPAIGRWMNIDALAEKFYPVSPYIYAINNPVYFIDPDGNRIMIGNKAYSYQEDRDYSQYAEGFERDVYVALDYLYSSGAMNITFGEGDTATTVNVLDALINDTKHDVEIIEGPSDPNKSPFEFLRNKDESKNDRILFRGDRAGFFVMDVKLPYVPENLGWVSPIGSFAHELMHEYTWRFDNKNSKTRWADIKTQGKILHEGFDLSFDNGEEAYITTMTNQVLSKIGDDKRSNYGIYYKTVASPAINTTIRE